MYIYHYIYIHRFICTLHIYVMSVYVCLYRCTHINMWFLFDFVLPMWPYPKRTEHLLSNLCTGNVCASNVFFTCSVWLFGCGIAGLLVQFPSSVQRCFIKVIMIHRDSNPRQGCTHSCLPL